MSHQPTDLSSAASASETDARPRRGARRRDMHRATVAPSTIESYLKANSAPRYMRRLREIETEFQNQQRRLEAAYAGLIEALGHDAERFSRRWRAAAHAWGFDRLNDLVRDHNAWYPVEANLPMDPRTRDYRAVRGASYRRVELGPQWVLERYPVTPGPLPSRLTRAPREPLPAARRRAGKVAG